MRRREFITLLGGAAAAWPLAARAQQPERMRRIGVLIPLAESDPEARSVVAAFVPGLHELGWMDGRNVRIDYRWAGGDAQRIQSFAKELVELKPDLIVARSSPVVAALLQQTRTIPIVFWQVIDPVSQGFVTNLARPGGNVTGFTTFEPAMGSKWLEVLKEVAPGVTRFALLFNPDTAPYVEIFLNSVDAASRSFAVTVIKASVRDAGEIERSIARFSTEPSGGMIVMPDAFTLFHRELIIQLAARHLLPTIYPFRYFAVAGGLLTYGTDSIDAVRRTASYADRILKGANPGDLPVQAPTKYELVINLKTAKASASTCRRRCSPVPTR
jgi:ABC-type uncharacterized transport system substrate-binding protein